MSLKYTGIIITGTSGAGKSTVARKFCEEHKEFQIVQAVTTRKSRSDDVPNNYSYISREKFEELDRESKLLIASDYRGELYGITCEALRQVIDNSRTPLLILTPKSVKKLDVKGNEKDYVFFTIFLDAPNNSLNDRLARRGEQIDENIKKQREEDRKYAENCLYIINNENLEDIIKLLYFLWEHRNVGGMLPKRAVELMIKGGMLLRNADTNKVCGASYDLSLGDQYWQDGHKRLLNDTNPFIGLKSGDYVIVSSKEIADFSKDIAGRFDLTVTLFCQGIILSNGPQVDPGFKGRLFCLLFNASNATITLKRGQHYATLEFIKLLEPTAPYSGKYQGKDDIIDYLPKPAEPSAIVELKKDVEGLKLAKWWEKTLPLILSILAIVSTIGIAVILFFIKK